MFVSIPGNNTNRHFAILLIVENGIFITRRKRRWCYINRRIAHIIKIVKIEIENVRKRNQEI